MLRMVGRQIRNRADLDSGDRDCWNSLTFHARSVFKKCYRNTTRWFWRMASLLDFLMRSGSLIFTGAVYIQRE